MCHIRAYMCLYMCQKYVDAALLWNAVAANTNIKYCCKNTHLRVFSQIFPSPKLKALCIHVSHRIIHYFRILHTVILDDPYDDPKELELPAQSPVPNIKDYEVCTHNSMCYCSTTMATGTN